MVIVEGVDNTGKTTLINKLCADLPDLKRVDKITGPGAGSFTDKEMWGRMIPYLRGDIKDTKNFILDRFHLISEQVYGPVVRGRCGLSQFHIDRGEGLLRRQRPLLIFCDRPIEDILATFDDREQMDGVKDKINKLRLGYVRVIMRMNLNFVTTYNYGLPTDEYGRMLKTVDSYLSDKR